MLYHYEAMYYIPDLRQVLTHCWLIYVQINNYKSIHKYIPIIITLTIDNINDAAIAAIDKLGEAYELVKSDIYQIIWNIFHGPLVKTKLLTIWPLGSFIY